MFISSLYVSQQHTYTYASLILQENQKQLMLAKGLCETVKGIHNVFIQTENLPRGINLSKARVTVSNWRFCLLL